MADDRHDGLGRGLSPRPVTHRTRWVLRVVLLMNATAVIAQPLLAGRYLSGDVDAIQTHSLNGTVILPMLCLVQVAAAVLFWRPGGGPLWPALLSTALFFAEGLQIGMGYSRALGVHIPLGVGIVTTAVGMFVWSITWRPAPRRGLDRATPSQAAVVATSVGEPRWR